MPEYLAPGVYVEEVSFRAKSIEGVSTSTCAMVGPTRKGPYDSTPELITSLGEYKRMFGGFANLSFGKDKAFINYMAHATRAFFQNGGRRLYISRTYVPIEKEDAPLPGIAEKSIANDVATIKARYAGSGYNGKVKVYLKASRVAGEKPLEKARRGALLRVKSSEESIAKPAKIDGDKKPPFKLNEGDKLKLKVKGADEEVSFQIKKQARVTAQDSVVVANDLLTIGPSKKIKIKIGDLFEKEISLPEGDNQLVKDIIIELNSKIKAGHIGFDGDKKVFVASDQAGINAEVTVLKCDALGFTARQEETGTGNVVNLDEVTVDEIDSAFVQEDIGVRASVNPATEKLYLTTVETGSAATLEVIGSAAKDPLGLPSGEKSGSDGASITYYKKKGNQWLDKDDKELPKLNPNEQRVFELLTFTLEAEDADHNKVLFEDLGFGEDHPRYIGKVLAEEPSSMMEKLQSPYYFVKGQNKNIFDLHSAFFPTDDPKPIEINGGDDGAEPVLTSNLKGAVTYSKALELLESIDDIAMMAAPGHSKLKPNTFRLVQDALITHAEDMKYRFAILDTPQGESLQEARKTRSLFDSSYAALYYPWITVSNPLWRPGDNREPAEINIPPSGFIAGIYARTDIARGVWKAPANEIVRGVLRFAQDINHAQQEVLNPEGINCLRFFFGRGYRVWGARTASSDPEWKYINVRRYFIYLEHSIDRSTQWAVFEPNGQRLWSNITDTVSAFLYNEWRSGALLGTTPEQAFFVRCDRSTMTQADLDNGRLICEVGVAALKPAEFVIFRIGQKTADAK